VILEQGAGFDEEAVRGYARQHLAAYKIPALFEIQDDFPRNASGKVLKRELRLADPSRRGGPERPA
jgi:fatty-acyl-CoA synthase